MNDSSTGETFTRDEVEDLAQLWAPKVRGFIAYLGQTAAEDPVNKVRYNWSDKKMDDVKILCYSVYFHHLLCCHLHDGSKTQKNEFVPTRTYQTAVNPPPLDVVNTYAKERYQGPKSSRSKQRNKSPLTGGPDKATSSNHEFNGQAVNKNPYPDIDKPFCVDPPLNQPLQSKAVVPDNDYRLTSSATAVNGHILPPQHSSSLSRPKNHGDQDASLEVTTGQIGVPLAQAWSDSPGQGSVPTISNTMHEPVNPSTGATELISEESSGRQPAWALPQKMGQSRTIYSSSQELHRELGETELNPHLSHPITSASSTQSSNVLVPATAPNSFQNIPFTTLSDEVAWAPDSAPPPETSSSTNLEVPTPFRGSTGIIPSVGTYHQRQSALSPSNFGFRDPIPTPSPSSGLFHTPRIATPWDVETPLSSSGAYTPQDTSLFSGVPILPESRHLEYSTPKTYDPRMPRIPGSDHFPSYAPPVGSTEDLDLWNKETESFRHPVGVPGASYVSTLAQVRASGTPAGHALAGTNVNKPMNVNKEGVISRSILLVDQRDSDSGPSQKRRRSQEETKSNDSLSREVQAAPPARARNQKKRKQNA